MIITRSPLRISLGGGGTGRRRSSTPDQRRPIIPEIVVPLHSRQRRLARRGLHLVEGAALGTQRQCSSEQDESSPFPDHDEDPFFVSLRSPRSLR